MTVRIGFPVQVDSINKHGILLQVVQVLTDMDLIIKKAYISSDGGWFMDGKVFPSTAQTFKRSRELVSLFLILCFLEIYGFSV